MINKGGMTYVAHKPEQKPRRTNDEGFMLLAAIVLVFLVLLALSIAAPRIATALKREREIEATHRAQQYQRAIRLYYRKLGHYPGSVDQLVSTNNQKFLRQKYLDPLTGKDDWRIIHVGENKTTVKGFFGEDLPGIGGAGLGSGIGGGTTTGQSAGSAFGGSQLGSSIGGSSSAFGGSTNTTGSGSGSSLGATNGTSSATGTGGLGFGSSSNGSNGTSALGGGGPIMGIGSSATGPAIVTVNEQTNYQDWEFLYDPRIEQLYAKGNLLGGVSSGLGSGGLDSGGVGKVPGFSDPSSSGPGTNGSGPGTTPTTPTSPSPF
jgi:type II secretory pathway pseudopilin PulG